MSKTGPNFSVSTIKSKPIQSKIDLSRIGQTADWSSLGRTIDLGLSNHTKAMDQIKVGEGKDQTKLQMRIEKAEREGKEDVVARLKGRQERQDVKQKAKAERITQRNVERLAHTTKRQEEKTKKFEARRAGADNKYETKEDNTVPISSLGQLLQAGVDLFKKDDSPVPMNMSAAQYKDMQKFSKIAKDI